MPATATKPTKRSKAVELPKLDSPQDRLRQIDALLEDSWNLPEGVTEAALLKEKQELQDAIAATEVERIPDGLNLPAAEMQVIEVARIQITGNHRELEHAADTARLAKSIRTLGLQQAIGVRASDESHTSYELIFGSRRLRAVRSLKAETIPARVYSHELTASEVELIRTVENYNRAELTPTERALAVARMIDRYTAETEERQVAAIKAAGGVHAYIGQMVGRPASWVRDHEYVNKLGTTARDLLRAGRIDLGHARELAKLTDQERQTSLAESAARHDDGTGGLAVPRLKMFVEESLRSLRGVKWRLDVVVEGKDQRLQPYACESCPHNSKLQPMLFEHEPDEDRGGFVDPAAAGTCLHPGCFTARRDLVEQVVEVAAKKAVTLAGRADGELTKSTAERAIKDSFVRGDVVLRRAKRIAEGDSSGAGRTQSEHVSKPIDPVTASKLAYEDDRNQWGKEVGTAITKAVKTPAQAFAFKTLAFVMSLLRRPQFANYYSDNSYADRVYQQDEQRLTKAIKQHSIDELIDALAEPTLEKLITVVDPDVRSIDPLDLGRLSDGVLLKLAGRLGITPRPAPDRASLIAAATPASEPAAAAKTNKKKGKSR